MSDRSEWVTLVDENDAVVGEVAPEVAMLLVAEEVTTGFLGGNRVKLLPRSRKHAGITVTVPSARPVSTPSFPIIRKVFTGASADVEIEYMNSDDKVRIDRAFVGTNKSLHPQGSASDKAYTSLDEWLMAVHEVKQAGHHLACLSAPKERVAVVLDYDTDMTYSLPFRHLYATSHGVQPATVKAWGFTDNREELLRQVRDHNLREHLIAGKADPLHEGVLDAQPDAELEALWCDNAAEILSAFDTHTESMKNQQGYLKSQQQGSR